MSIVSSVISKDRDDGHARMIEERHVDSVGRSYTLRRYVPFGYDATAELTAHAEKLAAELAEQEADEVLND